MAGTATELSLSLSVSSTPRQRLFVLALSATGVDANDEEHPSLKDHKLAKPNYSGEKRRKDLAKKAKKEEKRLRKLEAKQNPTPENADVPEPAENGQVSGDVTSL